VRYLVRLMVPRRGGWRAWAAARTGFERALADPAVTAADVASEHRRGADYVRVTIAVVVAAADPPSALAIAWDAFTGAAAGGLAGWQVTAAAAEVQPGVTPELTRTGPMRDRPSGGRTPARRAPGHPCPCGGPGRAYRRVPGR
jgi:hypothetical protein